MSGERLLLRVLRGDVADVPPIWLMRQAGRYLPEYRELRARASSFLEFCYTPAVAAEVTLQPIRRFGFDAAILFSDILVVPDAYGQKVSFESGAGPRLEPINEPSRLSILSENFDVEKLSPVFETIDRVKAALPDAAALIGFCGAPWTLASYMIAGHGTSDQAPARLFAFRYPEAFASLIEKLVDASIAYLSRQIVAGVDAVQIFDSWAGVLPENEFRRWVIAPLRRIVVGLKQRHPEVPIIMFARGAGSYFPCVVDEVGGDGFCIDTAMQPSFALAHTPTNKALQGNLDPLALLAGGDALSREVETILRAFSGRPHIFNLGHGILPETPIEHVERLVTLVRRERD